MGYVTFPRAVPFDYAESAMTKHDALKVLEEAAELVEAVKAYHRDACDMIYQRACHHHTDDDPEVRETLLFRTKSERMDVLDEAMDVYQALANLLAGEFSDDEIADAYERCVGRNRERGMM